MDQILSGYQVNEPTWFYLSLLLILAVFFRFNRLFSLRNADLLLAISISPGLLLVRLGNDWSSIGYVWLFAVTGILVIRLLFDAAFTRRPWIEPNMNASGMAFLCAAAFLFQTTRVFTEKPHASASEIVKKAEHLLNRQDQGEDRTVDIQEEPLPPGPTPTLFAATVVPFAGGVEDFAARLLAVLSHLAVALGLLAVGRWHFADHRLGWAMATLYLLLPPTAYDVTRVTHVLPAALIIWAFAYHHRPLSAGVLLGLACGTLFFAVFLLPLWMAYYFRRGSLKFAAAQILVAAVLLGTLALTSIDSFSFKRQVLGTIDWTALKFAVDTEITGFWSLYDPAYRVPVFALFLVLVIGLTIWPHPKTSEDLLANSTAIVAATQFWYPHQGGVYVLWYLPLFLMVLFRPKISAVSYPQKDLGPTVTASLAVAPTRRSGSFVRAGQWQ